MNARATIVAGALAIFWAVVAFFVFVWALDYVQGDQVERTNVEKCSFVCMLRHGDDAQSLYDDTLSPECTCLVKVNNFQHVME